MPQIKIDLDEYRDLQDIAQVNDQYGQMLQRCKGGRLTNSAGMYICAHCNADRSHKDYVCKEPRNKSLRHKAPEGECKTCDAERKKNNDFHPSHDASPRCESGKHNHCTCDICW